MIRLSVLTNAPPGCAFPHAKDIYLGREAQLLVITGDGGEWTISCENFKNYLKDVQIDFH